MRNYYSGILEVVVAGVSLPSPNPGKIDLAKYVLPIHIVIPEVTAIKKSIE